jgi:predicted transcriptional regulator of viral defense system
MAKEKYLKSILEFFKKTPVVSSRDIRMMIRKSKSGYNHLLVHNMIKAGRIRKIVKGFYTMHDDPTVSVFCFKPSYIGLHDALSIRNLWDQETNVTIITSRKVRTGLRNILGSNVVVHNIKPEYMFGYELVECDDFFIPVSDLEKTLIDFAYFGEHLDKETLKGIKRKIDTIKLKKYLKRYPKRTRDKVLKL